MLAPLEGSPLGWFALVCYVPGPLGSAIDRLARELSSGDRPEAHITVLPPRALLRPLREIEELAGERLEHLTAFEIGLDGVRRFPGTNVLYLDLAEGGETMHWLHDALDRDDLAYDEPFEFRPHLTLSESLPAGEAETVQRRAEALWKSFGISRFRVEEIVLLYMPPGEARQWTRERSFPLRKASPAQSGH